MRIQAPVNAVYLHYVAHEIIQVSHIGRDLEQGRVVYLEPGPVPESATIALCWHYSVHYHNPVQELAQV